MAEQVMRLVHQTPEEVWRNKVTIHCASSSEHSKVIKYRCQKHSRDGTAMGLTMLKLPNWSKVPFIVWLAFKDCESACWRIFNSRWQFCPKTSQTASTPPILSQSHLWNASAACIFLALECSLNNSQTIETSLCQTGNPGPHQSSSELLYAWPVTRACVPSWLARWRWASG